MSKSAATRARPISPHLQIYRLIPTMLMSIVHRITGGALYFGTLLVAWWLIAAATSESWFANAQWLLGSWLGLLVLIGFTWALFHHLLGGVRHLVWDTGHGFDLRSANFSADFVIAFSITAAVGLWVIAAIDGLL